MPAARRVLAQTRGTFFPKGRVWCELFSYLVDQGDQNQGPELEVRNRGSRSVVWYMHRDTPYYSWCGLQEHKQVGGFFEGHLITDPQWIFGIGEPLFFQPYSWRLVSQEQKWFICQS